MIPARIKRTIYGRMELKSFLSVQSMPVHKKKTMFKSMFNQCVVGNFCCLYWLKIRVFCSPVSIQGMCDASSARFREIDGGAGFHCILWHHLFASFAIPFHLFCLLTFTGYVCKMWYIYRFHIFLLVGLSS